MSCPTFTEHPLRNSGDGQIAAHPHFYQCAHQEDLMRSQSKPGRRFLFTIVAILVLLYGLFMLFGENTRKYKQAMQAASTAIELNNRAIRNEWATYDAATHQAIATGLPMTLTRIVVTVPPTP
jgi:hypothetical protein